MATKSKSTSGLLWSIIAIALALISIGYCASSFFGIFVGGWDRLAEAAQYIGRILKGGSA